MAFVVFPLEVWEHIMGWVENSSDILNVFQVYPELERAGLLSKTGLLWRFEKVLPNILTWIHPKDLFCCRQVCRNWCQAVDNNLAARNQSSAINLVKAYNFYGIEQLTRFLDMVNARSQSLQLRNPFVGRRIELNETHVDELSIFWNRTIDIVERFGEHLGYLSIHFSFSSNQYSWYRRLTDVLRHVPNLKGLRLSEMESKIVDEVICPDDEFLPILPNLETANFDVPQYLVDQFVTAYSPQIKTLTICHLNWKTTYCRLFPKLIDLTIWYVRSNEEFTDLLVSLDSPDLTILRISQNPDYDIGILEWLWKYFTDPFFRSVFARGLLPRLKSFFKNTFNDIFRYLRFIILNCNSAVKMPIDLKNLDESKIWEIFPKLDEVHVQERLYKIPFTRMRKITRAQHLFLKKIDPGFVSNYIALIVIALVVIGFGIIIQII